LGPWPAHGQAEGGDPLKPLAGDLALPMRLQREELAAGMGLATWFA